MANIDSRYSRPQRLFRFLRLPLLVILVPLSMGSGMGGSGCGDSDPPCVKGCAIEGTYAVTLAEGDSLPAGCIESGIALPESPFSVLVSRDEKGQIDAMFAGLRGGTSYTGAPLYLLEMWINRTNKADEPYSTSLKGKFTQAPDKATDPATFEGTFEIGLDYSDVCRVTRAFTAVRQ